MTTHSSTAHCIDGVESDEPRSAYIHVPFCAHRCGYCDFTLVAGRDDLIDDYLRALELQLKTLGEPKPVDTLYFGGGTPTHLDNRQLFRLLELVTDWFRPAPKYEFSVEANPAGLDDDKVAVLAEAGVNRVSLGAQSFDASVLRLLERDHHRADIVRAINRLRRRIDNVSLDLIFGVPGQSCASWRQSLDEAISLAPTHISTYGLTFEKGTRFWNRRRKGNLIPIAEEGERAMYALAMERLAAAGFEHYEISNFALHGRRCRHNQSYWECRGHWAFGPGAVSYLGGVRATNHRSVTTWLRRVLSGQSPIVERDNLSIEDRAREHLILALRTIDGVDRRKFHRRTGLNLNELAGEAIARYQRLGLLEDDGDRIRLTDEGRFVADSVIVEML